MGQARSSTPLAQTSWAGGLFALCVTHRGRLTAWRLGGLEAWRPGEIKRWLFCKSRCWGLTSLYEPRTAQALRIWWYFDRILAKIIEKSVFEGIWGTPNHKNVIETRQGIKNQRRRSPKIAPRRLKVVPNLTQARPTGGKLEAPQSFQEPNPLKIVEKSARIDAKTLKTWNLWNQQNQLEKQRFFNDFRWFLMFWSMEKHKKTRFFPNTP